MAMPMPAPDRSRNAVLAAAVVIALLAVVGLVVLLLGGFDDEGRPASTAPTASATPTGSASASPTPSPAGPTAAPPEAAPWEVDAAFVTPEAASAAEERGFSVSTEEGEPGPLLDPCGDGDFPLAGAIAASNERVLSSTREAGGSGLAQEVFRYATEQDAAAALAA